mmetsp:Transcript_21473/g.42632  ORF Transcript_21473/g.42632 Transcript_21473/m.42632 type:complete len:103 (+) Transcript_21473:399-707(+)
MDSSLGKPGLVVTIEKYGAKQTYASANANAGKDPNHDISSCDTVNSAVGTLKHFRGAKNAANKEGNASYTQGNGTSKFEFLECDHLPYTCHIVHHGYAIDSQ